MPTDYAIKDGRTVFDATTYTGNGSTQSITNAAGFKPDLVWYKGRSNTFNHGLFDSVRGTSKQLFSNTTDAEATYSGVTAFNSKGFSLGSDNGGNQNAASYVGWQWQAGQGTTSSNTSGTQTSTTSVNSTAGFSIVTFTMAVSGVSTVGHGLGVAPKLIIMKARTGSVGWGVYHASVGNGAYLVMNTTAGAYADSNAWNNTSPTSSVWTIGTSFNGGLGDYVAYCWAEIAGFSKFGSYTGNGSADGTFVYTGFRPKFILTKLTSGADQWYILDSSRDTYNVAGLDLAANQTTAEINDKPVIDFLSNGYKLRCTYGSYNASGQSYIYAAFAENPFKYANAR